MPECKAYDLTASGAVGDKCRNQTSTKHGNYCAHHKDMERCFYAERKIIEQKFEVAYPRVSGGNTTSADPIKRAIYNSTAAIVGRRLHTSLFFHDDHCEGHGDRVNELLIKRAWTIRAGKDLLKDDEIATEEEAMEKWVLWLQQLQQWALRRVQNQ